MAVPIYTIEALVGCGFLRVADQDELVAIMAALKRLGREPDIVRVT